MQHYGKMFFFSTSVALIGLHMATWISKDQSFVVRQVEVSGCSLLQPAEVAAAACVPMLTPMLELDVRAVRQRIVEMPLVKSAFVARQFPSTLGIRIQEVDAVALLNRKGLRLLDAQGNVLPMPSHTPVLDLPIVTGAAAATAASGEKVSGAGAEAIAFLHALRKANAALYHNISEVQLSRSGELVLYLMEQGVPVRMGKAGWLDKAEQLTVVLQHLQTRPEQARVAEFDLRFRGQVIARSRM